jgi:hypothetical protein
MVYHGRVMDGTIVFDPGIELPDGAEVRVELALPAKPVAPSQAALGHEAQLPRGASIDDLLRVAGTLDDRSAREMMQAIEEGCEQVDVDEW